MPGPHIQTSDLDNTFRALRNNNPQKLSQQTVSPHRDYKSIPSRNYAPTSSANTGQWGGGGMNRYGSTDTGTIYGQPQFFSPVHTPINWQIPSKRIEEMQWARFFYCLVPDSMVLMEDGTFKKICHVVPGDKIIDENGEIQPVVKVHSRMIDEEILEIKVAGNTEPIRITKSHEVKFVRKDLWDKCSQTTMSCSRKQSRINKHGNVDIDTIWGESQILSQGDLLVSPKHKCGEGYKTEILSDNLCYLLGAFAGDGSYYWYNYKGERKYPKSIRITVSLSELNDTGEKIKRIIRQDLKREPREYKNGSGDSCCDIVLHSTEISRLFYDLIGEGSATKKIKKEFLHNASYSQLAHFVAGYSDTDGCLSDQYGNQIRTVSENLASQLSIIYSKLNVDFSSDWTHNKISRFMFNEAYYESESLPSCNIRMSRRSCNILSGICEKHKSLTERHHLKTREYQTLDNVTYRKISSITSKRYNGLVYDLEINNNHTYCVNGCVVHNSNEPKVASAIDFYSYFPMSDWTHECPREAKLYFDKLKKRLDLPRLCRLISHEVHLLGDCFPLVEIACDECGGSGRIGSEICDHEGGTIRRVVILNPDNVDIYSTPLNPEPVIALKPNEELIDMVQRKTPGYERLSPEVVQLISSGQPIHLDNRSVGHLKYGECGYTRFGIGMVRRLFPILSYKTKLMVAQWIVAERLIIPIKVVKVGSDDRPAGPADIADVQSQLAQTANDPNLTIVTHHAFELDWYGASGSVLTLSNEFELINQEILDGMMINNALLNGEGPTFASASVGIEAMIKRLETFRQQISQWLVEYIYRPEAIRQGFVEKNPETGEDEYIVPTIKWEQMHLRDQQQDKTNAIQLYEKGLLSAQTLLELFGYDPDQEIERKRFDTIQMAALGQGMGEQGGGMGGMGGGMMGGGGDLGGGAPIAPPGGDMGGGDIGVGDMGGGDMGGGEMGGGLVAQSKGTFEPEIVNPSEFGGKVLTRKTREKMRSNKIKQEQQRQRAQRAKEGPKEDANGQMRDEKGRIIFTKPERELIKHLLQYKKNGIINYEIYPQYPVHVGNKEYPLDFAIPNLRLGLEADGEKFHGDFETQRADQQRDEKLAQMGWTILRFTDRQIEKQTQEVMQTIVTKIKEKENNVKQQIQEQENSK